MATIKFKMMKDSEVRTVWKDKEGELVYLYPCDFADTGVPIDEDEEDLEYVGTEVMQKVK